MKYKINFLFSAVVLIAAALLSASNVNGQEKFFFPFAPWRESDLATHVPTEGWVRFDSLMAASPDSAYYVELLSTADRQVKAHRDLAKGIEFEAVLQRPLNNSFSQRRVEPAVHRTGRDISVTYAEVDSAKDRGIYAIRTPRPPKPIASPDTLAFASSLDSVLVEVAERVVKRVPIELANGHGNGITAQVIEYYNVLDTLEANQHDFFFAQPEGRYRFTFFSQNNSAHKPFVSHYTYQGGVTELIKGELIAPPPPPPAEKEPIDISALAFGDGDGSAGAVAYLTLPNGFMFGAGFDGQDWSGDSQNGRELFAGYRLPKLPLFGNNLAVIVGFRNEAELRNYWDAWGGFGSLAFTPRLGGIQLFLQGGVRFMHVKNNLVLGGLIFENTDGGVRVSDEVIQKEGKKNEVSPFIRAGFGIHF